MTPRKIFLIALGLCFVALVAFALWRELLREESRLATSINGLVEVSPELQAKGLVDIVKTDRLALYLVDPETMEPVALRIVTPLVPPQTIEIGQQDVGGGVVLRGPYLLVGITDKDGELFKVTPGEVYGRIAGPIALGTERVRLVLSEPFRGSLFNEEARPARAPFQGQSARTSASGPGGASPREKIPMAAAGDEAFSIRGVVRVKESLRANVAPTDRLIILLFDPELNRPVATKIIPHTLLPQRFSISLPPGMAGVPRKGYDLRILTDKDGQPFNSAPGEVIGRSKALIPLGTKDLIFELDTPYRR